MTDEQLVDFRARLKKLKTGILVVGQRGRCNPKDEHALRGGSEVWPQGGVPIGVYQFVVIADPPDAIPGLTDGGINPWVMLYQPNDIDREASIFNCNKMFFEMHFLFEVLP